MTEAMNGRKTYKKGDVRGRGSRPLPSSGVLTSGPEGEEKRRYQVPQGRKQPGPQPADPVRWKAGRVVVELDRPPALVVARDYQAQTRRPEHGADDLSPGDGLRVSALSWL